MKANLLEELNVNVKALFKEGINIKQRFATIEERPVPGPAGGQQDPHEDRNRRNFDLFQRTGFDF